MELGRALVLGAEKDVAEELCADGDLDAILERHLATARAAWPSVHVDDARFVAHVAKLLPAGEAKAALVDLHAADVYLAIACGAGDERAIGELERRYMTEVPGAIAHLASRVPADEVVQSLRAKLLVAGAGARPKVLDYSGRGPLGAWLRVAAIRIALDVLRRHPGERPAVTAEVLLEVPAAMEDPELDHIRARHGADFKAAFEEALGSLTKEDRNLLRLHLVDGLNIDEIGAIFQVHRATAARWVTRCRDRIHDETRRRLAERLRLEEPELRSLLAILRSQLDLSISRLLARDPEE